MWRGTHLQATWAGSGPDRFQAESISLSPLLPVTLPPNRHPPWPCCPPSGQKPVPGPAGLPCPVRGWKHDGSRDAVVRGEGRAALSGRAGLDPEFTTCPSRHVSDEASDTLRPLVSAYRDAPPSREERVHLCVRDAAGHADTQVSRRTVCAVPVGLTASFRPHPPALPPPSAPRMSPGREPRAAALSTSLPVASGKDAARESVVRFWLSRQDLLMAWPSAVSEGDRHGVVFDLSHREN